MQAIECDAAEFFDASRHSVFELSLFLFGFKFR